MSETIREKLDRVLGEIDRPGAFCVDGSVPAVLPGLEVEGLGPVGLPLTEPQAKALKARCQQAPYGKGTETLVDTDVRRVWRLEPGRFALTNPDWDRFLAETVAKVQEELGLEKQELRGHLYDLLLYEPGSFFLPHRDGEKLDRMVATLVVVLPSAHEGGELVVRHDGEERVIDFGAAEGGAFRIQYAAFYADCEHEVRPVRKGYRLCLVYNLTLAKARKAIAAPRTSEYVERVARLLGDWAAGGSAGKLVVTLDHQYTKDGVAWDALKGVDRVKARVLLDAARRAGCRAYLALLTFWESGAAEYADGGYGRYGRRRRWGEYGEDEDDASQYEMGEIFDSHLTAEHWVDPDGHGLPIGQLSVVEEEVLDPEALTEVTPEEEFEGYTGNAGMTLERWYRHAAIFVWPERRHFEIICDGDGRAVVPELDRLVARWKKAKGKEAAALKEQCLGLAAAILAHWPGDRYGWARSREPEGGDMLRSLAALGDAALIRRFLGDVLIRDPSADPGKSLAAVCREHGWATFQPELLAVLKATTASTLERNVGLLEQVALAKPRKKEGWAELVAALAGELVATVEAIDRKPAPNDYYSRQTDRAEVLAGLARALIAADHEDLLSRVVDHAEGHPKVYPLREAHVPALEALRPWLKKALKGPFPPLARWVAWCREQLEALTAKQPQPPADCRRQAAVSCRCAECAELKRFLADPKEAVHRFSYRQERRDHLENQIRQQNLDLDCHTEERGRPYTLICTKNQNSFERELKTYYEDLDRLADVRTLEAALPG